MTHTVIQRDEMIGATLHLGGAPIQLDDYATTGIVSVAVGPRGNGKTNAGQLMAEQLSLQGWVSIFIDPEGEMESMYGEAVESPEVLIELLRTRSQPIVVVRAADATEFVPYGHAILEAADDFRKPIFLVIDEGQLFSAPRKRTGDLGEAADIVNDLIGRGRKRAIDIFITALRFNGTLHRSIFSNKNLTLIGCQEDPSAWSALAPQFKASHIEYGDLAALAPGEFFCISRRGVEKVKMPMAEALKRVAKPSKAVRRSLPASFNDWDRAMRGIPSERLMALTGPVTSLLGAVAGISVQQMQSGASALQDELEMRL